MKLSQMPHSELVKRENWRCPHGHNGVNHRKCYDLFHNIKEKVGFLDIETSNLKMNMGIVFSYAIKEDGGKIYGRSITPREARKRGEQDKALMIDCVRDMRRFDRLVVHYGVRFDIPSIRTKCIKHGVDFPLYKEIQVSDTWSILKYKFNLHRNRLETACDYFDIPSKGHRLNADVWIGALGGNKKDLDYIFTHNKEDVISLEALWNRISPYINKGVRSI